MNPSSNNSRGLKFFSGDQCRPRPGVASCGVWSMSKCSQMPLFVNYEGQSKITEPYLIAFESSKMDIY